VSHIDEYKITFSAIRVTGVGNAEAKLRRARILRSTRGKKINLPSDTVPQINWIRN
jgi:hypothetical protein